MVFCRCCGNCGCWSETDRGYRVGECSRRGLVTPHYHRCDEWRSKVEEGEDESVFVPEHLDPLDYVEVEEKE